MKSIAEKAGELIPEPRASCLTTHSVSPVVSLQDSVCQAQSPSIDCGKHSDMLQKCNVDESCSETKENQQTTLKVHSSVTADNGSTACMENLVYDHLSSCGFNAADWLDESFTDENSCTDTVRPFSHRLASKDNNSIKSHFKVYEDHDEPGQQNAINQTSRNSNAKVLRDRTNVVCHSLQMSTKKTSPVTKIYKGNDKRNVGLPEKTYGVFHGQGVVITRQKNLANNNVKLASRQVGSNVDMQTSEACSKICAGSSRVNVVTLLSAAVTRTELSTSNTVATASCQLSSFVSSSAAISKSSPVMFNSCMTTAVSIRMSAPNSITSALPVHSVTICSRQSVKCQPVGSIRSSLTSSCAVPKLFPSSFKTPRNQSSVRSSGSTRFSTPGVMVTPCNQTVRNSSMRPTPPMCSCGCRAKRKFVQSPGQNMGRPFYCCGANKRTPRSGCNFFKWENSPPLTPSAQLSQVTPLPTKQFLSVQSSDGTRYFTTPLSNHTREAAGSHILVPPSLR